MKMKFLIFKLFHTFPKTMFSQQLMSKCINVQTLLSRLQVELLVKTRKLY